MLQSTGRLKYSTDGKYWKLVVAVDYDLARLYRSFIPKSVKLNVPKYPPHVTVIRGEKPLKLEHWNKYHNKLVTFDYSEWIYSGGVYWWLNVYSKELEDIRIELGLPRTYYFSRPPDGTKCFHITIGNTKCL